MDVWTITSDGIAAHDTQELAGLLADPGTFVWVDMMADDPDVGLTLTGVFGFHDRAVRDCTGRNHVSKIHVYPDHLFTVVHAPHLGTGGHVHYVELDQFVGPTYVVTVHGPTNPRVPREIAVLATAAVRRRIHDGSLRPRSPMELSVAVLAAMVRHESAVVADLARASGALEQRVTDADRGDDPEVLLEELCVVRQELLAVRTMAALAAATYGRMAKLTEQLTNADVSLVRDIADRFELVCEIAQDQRDFVQGVLEFFATRTNTHMSLATERLAATSVRQNSDMRKITAWVAIVAVPTAVTGFYGQNVPYPGFGAHSGFVTSSVIILVLAVSLFVAFRAKKWL